jgi:hypothetical protein
MHTVSRETMLNALAELKCEIDRITLENAALHGEVERLRAAKSAALAVADERTRENAALRQEIFGLRLKLDIPT